MELAGNDKIVPVMRPVEQYHGILIRVLLKQLVEDKKTSNERSVPTEREQLTQCWKCRAILSRQSQWHAGKHQEFVLVSSTPNCELNHDLLAVVRLCLRRIDTIPHSIWLESTNQGYLRLVLEKSLKDDPKTQSPNDLIPSEEFERTKHSELGSVVVMYDVYQELKAGATVIPNFWVPKGPEIPRSARDSECLMVARSWLQTCQQEHPECRNGGMNELPTRVLDVSREPVRLRIPPSGAKGLWVALSYCWGTDMLLKTKSDNIESHKMGIAWHSLPKTHQDAVTITRALGLRFLWIDSLCIIQDEDGSDFHAEAAKMCDVYRHSSLTISGACSSSSDEGILWDRTNTESFGPNPREPARFQSLRCRPAIDHRGMTREEPIHSRAWTFQETILPRRLLSFCSREMTWECETLKQCECWRIHEQSDSGETYDDMGRAVYRRYTKAIMLEGCSAGNISDVQESHAQAELPNPGGQAGFSGHAKKLQPLTEQQMQYMSANPTPERRNLEAHRRYREWLELPEQARLDNIASLKKKARIARLEASYIERKIMEEEEVSFEKFSSQGWSFEAFAPAYLSSEQHTRYMIYASERDSRERILRDAIDEENEWRKIQLRIASKRNLRIDRAHLERKYANELEIEAFYRYWRQTLVPEYTRRCISKDEDRLIALQAIAGDVHSRISDQYCAGLWRKDLLRQLCWKSQSDENTPAANQSPSWSWSSIRGPIVPCLDARTEGMNAIEAPGDVEVEEVTCDTLLTSDPCGQLLGGRIKLYAWGLDVQAVWNPGSERIEFLQETRGIFGALKLPLLQFFPDTPLECRKGQPLSRSRQNDHDHGIPHVPNADHGKLPKPGAQALLLLVQENTSCVLVCSPTSEADVFRRVGIGLYTEKYITGRGIHLATGMVFRKVELI